MTKVRAAAACALVLVLAVSGASPTVSAAPASWLPRAHDRHDHPKLAAEFDTTPRSDPTTPVVVRVTGARVADLEAAVADVGGSVRTVSPTSVLASVPPDQLAPLADDQRVTRVSEPRRPKPAVTSEGVSESGATAWQNAGLDGTGVKLAIVDLGFQQLATEQAAGRLPLTVTTKSFCTGGLDGDTEHGTGVAEIAHQMAPKAQLYLVCIQFDDDLASAEQYLASQGVSIVNASFSDNLGGRGDGSGPLGDAVTAGRQAGQLWSVAAGNDADRHFAFTATDLDGDGAVEFSPDGPLTPGPDDRELFGFSLSHAGSTIDIGMKWDAWPTTNQQFNICLFTAGAPVGSFIGCQPSGQEASPGEPIGGYFASNAPAGSYVLAIQRGPNTTIAPRIDMYFEGDEVGLQRVSAAGSIGEPASSPAAMAVGAHNVNSGSAEGFSSQGPTIDGRLKPDVAAPDGVRNDVFDPFFGTSAAAPHAAGAAALVKQALPSATPAELQTFLSCRAVDGGAAGPDTTFGYGKLSLGAVPTAALAAATKPALVYGNVVFERSGLCSGGADRILTYGDPGDAVLLCDWDGNGTRTPGVFRNGVWFLRNAPGDGPADVPTFGYGDPGDVPVCGHWGGAGKAETPGVFRNGVFFLRDSNTTGVADRPPVGYGNPGDVPAVGDWDGNGTTTLGVFRNGVWFLRNSIGGGVADLPAFLFGAGGLTPRAWR